MHPKRFPIHLRWHFADRNGFPNQLFSMVLVLFPHRWVIAVEGSVSLPVATLTAMTAGSRFSCELLRLLVACAMDFGNSIPDQPIMKRLFVDDLLVKVKGHVGDLAHQVPAISRR